MIGSLVGIVASLALSQPAHATTVARIYTNTLPQANVVVHPEPPTKKRPESLGVKTTASSVFVADLASGSVLYAKDPHHVQSIASLTKLMTAMVFLDMKPDMKKVVTFMDEDFDHEAKPVFKTGERMTYEDVLRSMLVGSVNASANIIARTTTGKEKFVQMMNEKAGRLGLRSPVFVEPSGIDPGNRASAADVASIISTASGYPEIRKYTPLSEVSVHGIASNQDYKVKSTNLLLSTYLNKKPYTIVTGKTGSLPEAGYCMALVTKNSEGHQVVAVELGDDNHFARFQDIKALTTWAFDTYEWK